jgi:hypothetical protein
MMVMARNTRSFAVLRRCTTSLAVLSAAFAITLAGGPAPASAASIVSEMMVNGVDTIVPDGTAGSTKYAYYSLVNTETKPINDLIAMVITPTGSVVDGSNPTPLTVVNGSTGFATPLAGFSTGPGVSPQKIALDFSNEAGYSPPYDNPFAVGGVANFKLSLDPSTLTPPTLTLESTYSSLSLTTYTPAYANAAPGAMMNTPEPAALALWSCLACAGLLRARAFRRARR